LSASQTSDLDIFRKMQDSKLPVPTMVTNFQALTQTTASQLRRVADWVKCSIEQQPEPAVVDDIRRQEETRSNSLPSSPKASHFGMIAPTNLNVLPVTSLTSPMRRQSIGKKWMTKTIKKDGKNHTVAFCPACTTGHPWIIHSKTKYLLLCIDVTKDKTHI
jgi:hypothetical protein